MPNTWIHVELQGCKSLHAIWNNLVPHCPVLCVGHIFGQVDSNTIGGAAILTRGLAVNWSQLLSLFPFPICVVLGKDNHLIKYWWYFKPEASWQSDFWKGTMIRPVFTES